MNKILDDILTKLDKLDSIDKILQSVGNITSSIEEIKSKQIELESTVNVLSLENTLLKNKIETINCELDRFKQHSINTNLEIVGVPVSDNEDPTQIATSIFAHLGNTNPQSIKYAYRKKSKKNRAEAPSIIVATDNKGTRDQILKRKRKETLNISILGITNPQTTQECQQKRLIYVNEHLTDHNKYLLKRAKDLRRSGIVFGAWVRNGYIVVKKEVDSEEQIITKISQINEFDTRERPYYTIRDHRV